MKGDLYLTLLTPLVAAHITVVPLQLAAQEVLTPTPDPSPKNWGRGVNLMGCLAGAKRPPNSPVHFSPLSSGKGARGDGAQTINTAYRSAITPFERG